LGVRAWREQLGEHVGRKAQPSAAAIDSQSVKTPTVGGERGFDGGKQVKGRKRHTLVDTMGNLLKVIVTAANMADGKAAIALFKQLPQPLFRRLRRIWADGGYRGEFVEWVTQKFKKIVVDITLRSDNPKGFEVVPFRWVVERSLAWLEPIGARVKSMNTSPNTARASFMQRLFIGCCGVWPLLTEGTAGQREIVLYPSFSNGFLRTEWLMLVQYRLGVWGLRSTAAGRWIGGLHHQPDCKSRIHRIYPFRTYTTAGNLRPLTCISPRRSAFTESPNCRMTPSSTKIWPASARSWRRFARFTVSPMAV